MNPETLEDLITKSTMGELVSEWHYARDKHPEYPSNPVNALPIILEELGEVAAAINDNLPLSCVRQELAQTAITCIRLLEKLPAAPSGTSFIDDLDKMQDMLTLSADEFLDSYSYIGEDDYHRTVDDILLLLRQNRGKDTNAC